MTASVKPIVASLTDDSRGVIYICNIFMIHATGDREGWIQTLELRVISQLCYQLAHCSWQHFNNYDILLTYVDKRLECSRAFLSKSNNLGMAIRYTNYYVLLTYV